MPVQFKEQGGAATMDPGIPLRWVTSRLMTRLCQPRRQARKRAVAERKRIRAGRSHSVEYFHQVEDGYSYLAAQLLPRLLQRYDIELKCHLVGGPRGKNAAEPELLLQLSRYDAFHVAPGYGLDFPRHDGEPPARLVTLAAGILARQAPGGFVRLAAEVGRALWRDDGAQLQRLADRWGRIDSAGAEQRLAAGTARQRELGHYSGAMFYYAGEWYWGVDRLYHLEQRLADLGIDREPASPPLVPRPAVATGPWRDDGRLTLEVYASLRSPYTAIGFDRAVQLARATGVNLAVRPVLPMVMRGAPITRQKGSYIFQDAAREARAAGVPFGNFYDPVGDPVRRGYSLYPWACERGRGVELISAFLHCAFARGINLNRERGLRQAVEMAGLPWGEARTVLGASGWEDILEENRQAMYRSGLWGVPSFRLFDDSGEEPLALWGQDRLWLLAREIQRRLAARQLTCTRRERR